jgi:uncharacterized membrane protein
MKAEDIFDGAAKQQIVAAIKAAEKNTSGEIRLHIENHCYEDVMDHAAFIFEKLEMHKTKERNGVLFYVALNERLFAILGDAGINSVVPKNFWEEIKKTVIERFKTGQFAEGLSKGISMAGEQLKAHFPYQSQTDTNELSDEISFGKS